MRYVIFARVCPVLVTLALVGGTSSLAGTEGERVASVGDRPIYASEVLAAGQKLVDGGMTPEEAKQAALRNLIDRRLLVLSAEAAGYEQSEQRQEMWQRIAGDELTRALREDLTRDVTASEEDLARLLELGTFEVLTREMILPDRATVDAAMAELEAGRPFAEVAAERTIDPSARERGGLAEYAIQGIGLYMSPYRELIEHDTGDVVGPIHLPPYYSLLLVEERRPAARQAWTADLLRPRYEEFLRDSVLTAFLEEKKRLNHYEFNEESAKAIAQAVTRVYNEDFARQDSIKQAGGEPATLAELLELPGREGTDEWGLTDAQRAEWVFKHDGGGRTVGTYVDRMLQVPRNFVFTNTSAAQVRVYCEEFFTWDVYPEEARLRGLDEVINLDQMMRDRYEKTLTEQFVEIELLEKINPGYDELLAYWKEHLDIFPGPIEVVASGIFFDSPDAAREARLEVDRGATFEALAQRFEANDVTGVEVVRRKRARTEGNWWGAKLRGHELGKMLEAMHPDGRECILMLHERGRGEPDFSWSRDDVLGSYREMNSQPLFDKLMREARETYPVVIHEDAVEAIPFPD